MKNEEILQIRPKIEDIHLKHLVVIFDLDTLQLLKDLEVRKKEKIGI